MIKRVMVAVALATLGACGPREYDAPDRETCRRVGGVFIYQYKSEPLCIRRDAVIDERRLDGGQ